MGSMGLAKICESLIKHGSPEDLPIALIEQGTTAQQRITTGTLTSLPISLTGYSIAQPALIIIGTVVSLQQRLQWFGLENATLSVE
jgi:uroporphyrin-III C-methyltransferase/precorrin-2 dehydrogenase/sirohydrochlorin ferrochelatase